MTIDEIVVFLQEIKQVIVFKFILQDILELL